MRKGFTLVEMLITMLVFSITLVAIMSFFTKTAGTSLKALNRVDTYGDLFEANSILQQEISKAGPDIRYINLVNNLEPSGVNIILSTTPKEGLEFEFTSLGTRSISYKITINKNGTKYEHKSSVFLINIR